MRMSFVITILIPVVVVVVVVESFAAPLAAGLVVAAGIS